MTALMTHLRQIRIIANFLQKGFGMNSTDRYQEQEGRTKLHCHFFTLFFTDFFLLKQNENSSSLIFYVIM